MADRRPRADAQRNRERVLQAAREAFAAAGFGVPLDEIAARAGVGPGTVYRHFPSKEALFEAVMTARVAGLVAAARACADSPDPGAAFFGFLGRIGEEAAAKRDLTDAIAVPGALLAELYEALDVLLRRAQAAGAVRADVTAPELIILLKAVLVGLHEAAGQAGPHEAAGRAGREELAGRWIAILGNGLRPPPTH